MKLRTNGSLIHSTKFSGSASTIKNTSRIFKRIKYIITVNLFNAKLLKLQYGFTKLKPTSDNFCPLKK